MYKLRKLYIEFNVKQCSSFSSTSLFDQLFSIPYNIVSFKIFCQLHVAFIAMQTGFHFLLFCLLAVKAEEHIELHGGLHITIHKVLPGDPFYQVFNGNTTVARIFVNAMWRRLLNRYDTINVMNSIDIY